MIKIIAGVYGHYISGKVVAKDATSAPFELTAEQEARLVGLGIAEYVAAPAEATADTEDAKKPLADMTNKELAALGAEYGLEFKKGAKKADMIAAIDEAEAALDTEDGLEAPDLDPAAAVVE